MTLFNGSLKPSYHTCNTYLVHTIHTFQFNDGLTGNQKILFLKQSAWWLLFFNCFHTLVVVEASILCSYGMFLYDTMKNENIARMPLQSFHLPSSISIYTIKSKWKSESETGQNNLQPTLRNNLSCQNISIKYYY